MTAGFTVETSPRFRRLAKGLRRQHPEFNKRFRDAIEVLTIDPYNQSRHHAIKKLTGQQVTDGQWRLRLGRWRFRYDILERTVELKYCGLRREETYS